MIQIHLSVLCLAAAASLSGPAFAQSTTTGGTTSTVRPLNFSMPCPGGGTRTATGTWDSAPPGALSMNIRVTNCKWSNDEVHNGTRTTTGFLTAGAQQTFRIDLTMQENFTVTRDGATRLTHSCTVTKRGTLDDPGDRFTGTITRNCTNSGEIWDPDHWAENIMRHTLAIEVPRQDPTRVVVPPRGSGNACNRPTTGTTGTTGTSGTTTTHNEGEGEVCGDR